MSTFLNPGNAGFCVICNATYIDKTGLIEYINETIQTPMRFTCFTRARRFGKSFAAKMLCAYYDKSCDSKPLFEGLEIAKSPSFEKYLNRYNVVYLDITAVMKEAERKGIDVVSEIWDSLLADLREAFPGCTKESEDFLPNVLREIHRKTGEEFVFIIDEWDAPIREVQEKAFLKKYMEFYRVLFKAGMVSDECMPAVFMTGILPVRKYGSESAVSDFWEFTMEDPLYLAKYVGFTEDEVRRLCEEYETDFVEMKQWYDGYSFDDLSSVYNPNSVMRAVKAKKIKSYWTKTETFEALKHYISMNFNGLQDAIVEMLGGERVWIRTNTFQNDISSFDCMDDVLTLLVHLGYLAYDESEHEVYIPNREVAEAFEAAVATASWKGVSKALEDSERLLRATLRGDAAAVANALELVHESNSSVLAYHNENSLACAIRIAYYTARNYYDIIQEFPSGKGFADIVFLPFKNVNKPALLVELKCNRDADSAIRQIKEKRYAGMLKDYAGRVLLVGINYDKEAKGEGMKAHSCVIEEM